MPSNAYTQKITAQSHLERSGWLCFFLCMVGFAISCPTWAADSDSLPPRIDTLWLIRVHPDDLAACRAQRLPARWLNDTVWTTTRPGTVLVSLREQGHLAAALQRLPKVQGDTAITAQLYLGPVLRWITLRPADSSSAYWMEAVGWRSRAWRNQVFDPVQLVSFENTLLETAENSGYPFARISLDSLLLNDLGGVKGVLRVSPGPFIRYKSVKISGDVKLPNGFLERALELRAGDRFSRAKLANLGQQLQQFPYLELSASPSVAFAKGEAELQLRLKKKKAGRFDFIVGLLPQPASTPDQPTRLLLTGSLNAGFQNAIGWGERFSAEIERLRPETQQLKAAIGVPYLLGSPFGVDGQLHIFRRDTTWAEARGRVGVEYAWKAGQRVVLFWENRSSSLQQIDTVRLQQSLRLPEQLDYRQNAWGFDWHLQQFDNPINPRRGWLWQQRVSVGQQQIRRNPTIDALQIGEFRFSKLYDSLSAPQLRLRVEGQTDAFLPVTRRTTLLLRARGGALLGSAAVLQNEQYRLGGNKLLRGFNEESLFASRWMVLTAEYRLLLGPATYMAVFSDYGYLENLTPTVRQFQRPWGLGAGMNFETAAGIFGISAAVGRIDAVQGFDFNALKFHLGYVNLF
jgi:outer membrane protein assembly factor BamA